jgi:ankyrin repeat protein
LGQVNPKSAFVKDDDERLPIHWAVAYNRLPVVELLVAMKDFDPDVEVSITILFSKRIPRAFLNPTAIIIYNFAKSP